jgi:hypothetical protein
MMRISPLAASSMKRRVVSPIWTSVTRNSVDRLTLEISEVVTIAGLAYSVTSRLRQSATTSGSRAHA